MAQKLNIKAFWIVAALLLAASLSYFGICSALATHYVDQGTLEGYQAATRIEPTNPDNWRRLGDFLQSDLQHANPQRAILAYRHSISLNQNSAAAWMGLASVYEGQGNLNAAREAFFNAKRAYPKSADVSWRYANFLVRIGELDFAFSEARQTLENEPQRAWEAFNLFQRFDPDVNDLLDRLMPRQESAYLDVIWGLGRETRPADARQVWDRLNKVDKEMPQHPIATGNYQLTRVILISLVDQLISEGNSREAGRVWKEILTFMSIPERREPSNSLVWDGGFETDITGGLSWRTDAPMGSLVGFSRKVKHSGDRALEIKFDGKYNVNFNGACETVVVEPDTLYDFSAWLRTENITTDRGVFLRLSTPKQAEPDIITEELTGTHAWTKVGFRWKAPTKVRLARICLVRSPSDKMYNAVAGTAWLDDVQMVPINSADTF